MQIERELAHIVTPLPRKKVKVFWKSSRSLTEIVYTALRSDQIKTEADAAALVFGDPDIDINRYRAFKSRFRERLLNSLFFLELSAARNGAYATELYKLHKQVFWTRVLAMFGARNAAIYFCRKALLNAEFYQLTLVQIELLDFLARHYGFIGKRQAYAKVSALLEKKLELLHAEHKTSRMYQSLTMEYVRSAVPKAELMARTQKYYVESNEIVQRYRSYNTMLDSIRIGILYHQVSGQFTSTLQLCDMAEKYFKLNEHLTPSARLGELEINRLESYLYLRDYENGSETALRCAAYFPVGRNNWFYYMEYYFLLAMHTLRFERAAEIYEEVSSHPRFALQQETLREKWRVFAICLGYAHRATIFKQGQASVMDADTLLETVPIYSRDKQGYNVPILVMHILLLLERGDLDAITQRMEALKTYRTRYLRARTNRQSAIFFKLLTIMEANSFDHKTIVEKGQKLYEQLQTLPSAYTEVHEGVQILSYAWLWERVLERLEITQDHPVITE